ncbi:lycopene epsilon cyclase, chloroplastic-like [Hibiscus syriacus]|uniref:lycopene epsilon cyclase, chloroplastic-like n=1 Tax=Hibiscus syriacus TaxID=106335 RepID=UPI001924EBC3|nr:lycopene epsilon cyclase, chloroplastic-like [Hibiscus syriacus]
MECVGARNLTAMSARASGARGESCVAVKEDFADEEDFIKAGGSELLFVQMQRNKEMDTQSKLADKSDLGLERCIEQVWRDTIVYLDDDKPIMIGRAYGRVSRHLLHEELLRRCVESGVMYLNSKVETIIEATDGHNLVPCGHNRVVPCRLVTVASGAASGKLLQYEVGGPRVSIQTAYGIEVDVENNPYDPSLKVFMDYRDYTKQEIPSLEAQCPTFLYAMPMSSTRVFFEETCLASKDAIPFDLLKKKLMLRLETMGIRILKVHEEEWSYTPVGGSLPNTEQKILAFGAAASMVHPATGYSVVRSLSKAPNYASVIANILKKGHSNGLLTSERNNGNISMHAWNTLWPQEKKRQRAFFLFGLALILQLDIEGIRTFFHLPRLKETADNASEDISGSKMPSM